MPLIQVSLIAGRPPEAKRALIAELTDAAVRAIGSPRESVRVILNEIPDEHWGVGGQPKSSPADPPLSTDRSNP